MTDTVYCLLSVKAAAGGGGGGGVCEETRKRIMREEGNLQEGLRDVEFIYSYMHVKDRIHGRRKKTSQRG